jgi:hypothetical protein
VNLGQSQQEYLLIPTTYHPNITAAFSVIIRSHPALGLLVDPDPFGQQFLHDVFVEGLWRGAAGGVIGGGAPSSKSFMNNPQFVLSVTNDGPRARAPIDRPLEYVGTRSTGGDKTNAGDLAETFITLRVIEEVKKAARGAPSWTERIEHIPKLGIVVVRLGEELAGSHCRLDRKPPRSWIVFQTHKSIHVNVWICQDYLATKPTNLLFWNRLRKCVGQRLKSVSPYHVAGNAMKDQRTGLAVVLC